jgi:5-methylcytosine-specific restriction protein A
MPKRAPTLRRKRAKRPSAAQRLYGRRWAVAALLYLNDHPLCAECRRQGRPPQPATCVDHVTPHRGDLRLFWNQKNWQGLCASCHSRKTLQEQRAGG